MHPSSKLCKLYINLTYALFSNTGLFQNEEDDRDSGTDYFNSDMAGTQLQRDECVGDASLPDTFQTNELLYYERFKAYQDYMLGM